MNESSLLSTPDTIPTPDGWCHRCGVDHDAGRCWGRSQPDPLGVAAGLLVNEVIDLADSQGPGETFLDRVSPELLDAVAAGLARDAQTIRDRAARLARAAS